MTIATSLAKTSHTALPTDAHRALLIGRVWVPSTGPVLCVVTPQALLDLSALALTSADLLALPNSVHCVLNAKATLPHLADTQAVLANSHELARNPALPHFLAPCDLQPIKAAGVTFVASMLERVIEEQARGDASRAQAVRESIATVVGDNLRAVVPGSAKAMEVKALLMGLGLWSQYLEVGIGKDAEVFTKSQAMSAVGFGAQIGIHPDSQWNNPEPEIVLAVSPSGIVIGATLGNDVNLRDVEGRSALLLGKAKDNNASCAIGPFIRLFDDHFSLDDVRQCDLTLQITGQDGFVLQGSSSLSQISRDPLDLVAQTMNAHHQYPDGFMLFLGTMFAPTQDRPLPGKPPGQGFTHAVGDVVTISTPLLGQLTNRVNTCDQIAPWTFGVSALIQSLAQRR